MRRVRRLADDRLQLRLTRAERDLFASLFPQLTAVFDGSESVAHLRGRLFPDAYDDPEAAAEYHALVDDDLVAERHAELATVLSSLEQGQRRAGRATVELDDEGAHAWLSVLQSTRLVLAQIVGITSEEDWERDPATADPDQLVLWYVGALQEELLEVLMGAVDQR